MLVIPLERYEAGDLLVAGKATERNCPINEKSDASLAATMHLSSEHLGDGDEEPRPPGLCETLREKDTIGLKACGFSLGCKGLESICPGSL